MHAQLLSRIHYFATSWIVTHQSTLSMGFSRQEYGSGVPFPSPGDLPDPGIKSVSPALADRFFTTESPVYMKFIIGVSSCYGGWKVTWSTICNLENQEGHGYNSVKGWRPVTQGVRGCWCKKKKPWYLRGQQKMDVPAEEEGDNLPFLGPFVLFRTFIDGMRPAHFGEGRSFFSQPTIDFLLISLLISSGNSLKNTPRKQIRWQKSLLTSNYP